MNKNSAVQSAQMRQMFSASNVSLVTSTLIATIFAYMQREVVGSSVVLVWLSLVVLIALFRAVLVNVYQGSPADDHSTTSARLAKYRLAVLMAGLVFGSAGFLMFPTGDPQHQMFLIFMLAGLSAGSVISYSADLVCAIGFSVTTLVPIILRLFVEEDSLSVAMGAAAMLYLGFIIMAMRHTNRSITENISLRLEALASEETIRASEARYRLLLDHSPVGIFHYDANLVITYCNDRFADILHSSIDHIIGLDMRTLKDQSVLPTLRNSLEGKINYYEGQYRATFSDSDGWIDMTCAPSRNGLGKIVGGIAIVRDVTEQKQAEMYEQFRSHTLELLSGNEQLSTILIAIVRGMEQLNPSTLCSILLLDKAGKHLGKCVAPSLPDFYNAAIDGAEIGMGVGSCGTAAFTGERVIVEDIATHPYWVPYKELAASAGLGACWSQPIRSSSGKILGTLAIYHHEIHTPTEFDMCLIEQSAHLASIAIEHKQAEAALLYSEQRFRDVSEATGEYIWEIDVNLIYTYVSRQSVDVKGYTPDELLGHTPIEFMPVEDIQSVAEIVNRAIENNSPFKLQHRDITKSGAILWEEVSGIPFYDENGVVIGLRGTGLNITERKQAEEEIYSLAFYDTLTRLPNRRLLMDRLRSALSLSARSHHYGAVMFLDIDKFKTINDTLGHDYGDLLLIEVAKRIQSCVREVDTVARLGGDEFMVLLEEVDEHPEAASQKIALIAEKIRASLTVPYQLKNSEYHSSPSIGVSLFRGKDESADDLLKHADMAMYQAKDSGRNAVRFFDPAMQLAVEVRAALEVDLRHAILDHQLHLYYQVQVDNDHRPLGAEVLARWIHPTRGMISPAQFIPIAEESSLILDIGGWVLDTACRQLGVWAKDEQKQDLTLSVNVSAQQFKQHDFVEQIATVLRVYNVDASRLKLELTESVVLNDLADVVTKMHALKALGVSLSMDDFGTGYSSLSYLKQLPLDQIKIDQSFVRDIATDPNDAVMVQTIIDLAKNFRLNVIAEGVETEVQRAFLAQHGCMAYQGYFFSKPVPLEQFEVHLKQY